MKPILEWQYDQLVKELILLQEHQADPHCPCETAGEMCVRKHLMTIEAYAEETLAIEEDKHWRDRLMQLATEAKEHRDTEEKALCGEGESVQVLDWSRYWRKEFEMYSLACEVPEERKAPEPEQRKTTQHGNALTCPVAVE
ncbi:MAG: hypothetical protein ABFD96_06195 [Armatimonadia bacterium]